MPSKGEKKLFTPGPLSCSATVKAAMQKDVGSRDGEFIQTVEFIRRELLHIQGLSAKEWTSVPLQGSGTFAVEAVINTCVPRNNQQKVLVLSNGSYGQRIVKICQVLGLGYDVVEGKENVALMKEYIEQRMSAETIRNNNYRLICLVHSETSSGVLNDVSGISRWLRQPSVSPDSVFFVDAMSSFGATPVDCSCVDFLVSSANKCLQGVPGFAFVLCRKSILTKCKGNSRSLVLDLFEQEEGLEKSGQFRFTPPTHAMLAFKQALDEFEIEGGVQQRAKRYRSNRDVLRVGMAQMGFRELVPAKDAGIIITAFLCPKDDNFSFEEFSQKLAERDQVIYPGKVTEAETFRIGNIGHLFPDDMRHLVSAIRQVLAAMRVAVPVAYE